MAYWPAQKRKAAATPKGAAAAVFAQQYHLYPHTREHISPFHLSRSSDSHILNQHTAFSGSLPMTDFRPVCSLHAYSGGTVPDSDRIHYSPLSLYEFSSTQTYMWHIIHRLFTDCKRAAEKEGTLSKNITPCCAGKKRLRHAGRRFFVQIHAEAPVPDGLTILLQLALRKLLEAVLFIEFAVALRIGDQGQFLSAMFFIYSGFLAKERLNDEQADNLQQTFQLLHKKAAVRSKTSSGFF